MLGRVFVDAEHPFSFVDATSFVSMRQQRIRYAFAFDQHFATAGFIRVPEDLSLPALQQMRTR